MSDSGTHHKRTGFYKSDSKEHFLNSLPILGNKLEFSRFFTCWTCWEGLGAGGKGDDRGWDGWMASPTQWMWVWVNSGSWWWTGRPGMLWFMGSQRVGHDWATKLNWTWKGIHYLYSFKYVTFSGHMVKCNFFISFGVRCGRVTCLANEVRQKWLVSCSK